MAKYVCDICNWEYDEAAGLPDQGIAPGTKWEELLTEEKYTGRNQSHPSIIRGMALIFYEYR